MKGRSTGFLTETDRGSPTKKAGKSPKKQLVFMKGKCAHESEKYGFSPKRIGGPL